MSIIHSISIMSIIHSISGQFQCALIGGHTLSEEEENRLFESKECQIDSTCSRCGVPIHVEICKDRDSAYTITEKSV
jgi:hypothetical protein